MVAGREHRPPPLTVSARDGDGQQQSEEKHVARGFAEDEVQPFALADLAKVAESGEV